MTTLYVNTGYWNAGYAQTGITVEWGTRNIFVPRSELTLIQSVPTVVYNLDLNAFRLALTDAEDSEAGVVFPPAHRHNTTVVLSGITYAQVIEIINSYTVEFQDGQYAVNLIGANSNVADQVIVNQVSVRATNSAGLVQVSSGSGLSAGQDATLTAINAAVQAYLDANISSRLATSDYTAPPTTNQITDEILTDTRSLTVPKFIGLK